MFILCLSGYLLATSLMLLFIRCASYNVKPCVLLYESKLPTFYDMLFDKMNNAGNKISFLARNNSFIGVIYRVLISKEYLLNQHKYKSLGFSEDEHLFIEENIIPGLHERVSIFKQMYFTVALVVVVVGAIIGINLR